MYGLTQSIKANATQTPESIATVMGDRKRTWREFVDRVSKLASAMQHLGIKKGDRIAVLSLNSDRYLEAIHAAWWMGALIVPMNTRWSVDENIYSLNDSGAVCLFVDNAFETNIEPLKAGVKTLKHIIHMDDGIADQALGYEALISASAPAPDAEYGRDDLAGLLYTGGTSGFPKGVVLSHEAIWFNHSVATHHFDLGYGCSYLHAAPMFHVAGLTLSGAATMGGAKHVFVPGFEPNAVMEQVEKHKITHCLFVPAMFDMLLKHPSFEASRLSSLQRVVYGASPMPAALLDQIINELPELDLIQVYGQTELAPIVTFLGAEHHKPNSPFFDRRSSAGRACPGVEIRICSPAGEELPNGEVGEVYVRSPGRMQGYWNLEDATAEALEDGWVKTGDGAYRDDDGFIFIVDRLKDMIITGGENVFSSEVENVISHHPDVQGVAVIGVPSEEWGETVHAIIIPNPGSIPSAEDIQSFVAGKIANYKKPKSISFRTEPFPLSGPGKILKRELRKPFWEGKGKSVN